MAGALVKSPEAHDKIQSWIGSDDFSEYVDAQRWTKLAADSGSSVAAGDNVNGVVTLTTGATNNNEASFYMTNKCFLFADQRAGAIEALVQYAEAAINVANIAFGVWSAPGANMLIDDGAGPATTASGALIYKVDGGTAWKCISSKSTTQTITTSKLTAGGTSYVRLRVEWQAVGDPALDLTEVTFFVDDKPLFDAADTSRNKEIKHIVTHTSAAAMTLVFYVKAGDGTTQTYLVDLTNYSQGRTTLPT